VAARGCLTLSSVTDSMKVTRLDEAAPAPPRGRRRVRRTGGDREPDTDLTDLRWVVGVWLLVLAFGVVTAIWSEHVGVPLRDPRGQMFQDKLRSALELFVLLVLADALVRTLWTTGSLEGAFDTLRRRWPWRRVALAVSGLVAYHIVYICYRNLKSWDTFNTPRDQELLAFERWLFLGHSPAQLLHQLIGHDHTAYILMLIYRSFTYLVPLSVVGALVFTDRIREGYVFLTSAMWVWILGVGSYYLIPSLGPFASDPGDFTSLPESAITRTQTMYLNQRANLLENPGAADAFASISAFASLHVGFSCLILLMLRYYGQYFLAGVMTAYVAATMVATVYFGWHFVVDDVAGVLLAVLSVALGRAMMRPRGRP
jgi:predicted outer membrane lipoprotein